MLSFLMLILALCSHLIYRDYSVNEGAMKIDRLRTQDAGTYICNAQNDMGKYEHTTSLVVGGKALHKKGVRQPVTSYCYKIAVL